MRRGLRFLICVLAMPFAPADLSAAPAQGKPGASDASAAPASAAAAPASPAAPKAPATPVYARRLAAEADPAP